MPPDLEATMMQLLLKSMLNASRIWFGSVESKIVSSLLKWEAITSGAKEDPPIPHRMKCACPNSRDQAESASKAGKRSRELSGKSTQSSLTAASAAACSPQSDGFFVASEGVMLLSRSQISFRGPVPDNSITSENRPSLSIQARA